MTRKQEGIQASVEPDQIPAQFYVDRGQWDRFAEVSRMQNRSRSAQLRELVQQEIRKYEAPLEEAA